MEADSISLQIRKLIAQRSSDLPIISQLISTISDKARITSLCPKNFFQSVSLLLFLVALGTERENHQKSCYYMSRNDCFSVGLISMFFRTHTFIKITISVLKF